MSYMTQKRKEYFQTRANKAREDFYVKARAVHGTKFQYGNDYKNSQTKIRIKCKQHGYFLQTPAEHLRSPVACPKCDGKGITTADFIQRSRKVHGDKYDYSKAEYKSSSVRVVVTCKEHGDFRVWDCGNLVYTLE